MKKCRTLRLRWSLAVPLAVTFFLLWFGTMVVFTVASQETIETEITLAIRNAREVQEEQWGYYEKNLSNGLGAKAGNILQQNMNNQGFGWVNGDGVLALVVRDGAGREMRNQIAWGYGHEEGVDMGERWYLELDSGLDDAGQKSLANWLIEHRKGWDYTIYPADPEKGGLEDSDGTFARVTGLKGEGNSIHVQRIQLIHPDGAAETVVETAVQGEDTLTMDFAFLRLASLLLPSYSTAGDGPVDMDLRLSNYHNSHAILDDAIAGEPTGRWAGVLEGDNVTLRMVACDLDARAEAMRRNWGMYLSTFLLTAVVLLVLSGYLSRRVTRPVEGLCAKAEKGELCPQDGPITELNTLAAAVNTGQERMREQLQRERDFTRAAAHELKTPLAILRAHAESLKEDIEPTKRGEYLDTILSESDRMTDLITTLLNLARIESGQAPKREPVEMSELVERIFERLALPLERKKIKLHLELSQCWVEGGQIQLELLTGNLASNALYHCPAGGTITVTLAETEDRAVLTVDNDGQTIPESDLSRIWEPFYRGDQSRSRSTGGTGLGLALVKAAAQAHGGCCSVSNRKGGVTFRVELPSLQSAQ